VIPIKGVIAIQVKVAVAQAQAALAGLKGTIAQLQGTLGGINTANGMLSSAQGTAAKSANSLTNRLKESGKAAMKSASQFQWYSRQLMYNVALPLLVAGGYAGKWALETQAAMIKVSKVYGDLTMDPKKKKAELDALAGYFEAVSNRYGMLQKDVIAIGAEWAAAGAKSVGLAEATKLTVETMILGEMSAEESTKALLSIQAAWGLSASQLKSTIGELNLVENQTTITMQGLIEGFVRTGSAARIAGLSTGDLAALFAALVPAAGNATVAGNSLKTILSRLAKPTASAANGINFLLKSLNLTMDSKKWTTMGARQQLELLAGSFSKLDKNQQQQIATDISGRQQYNRFVQLMNALSDANSNYYIAQDALRQGKEKINGVTFRQIQYERELNQVLQSNPQQIKIVLAQLQNMAIRGIAPLIPYFIAFIGYVKQVGVWLGNLPPAIKNFVASAALFALIATLVMKIISPFKLLFGMLAEAVPPIMRIGKFIIVALVNPWGIAVAAIIAIVAVLINFFPQQWNALVGAVVNIWNGFIQYMDDTSNVFGKIISNIIDAWFALPYSVRQAMQAVVNIVAAAAQAIYNLFSYINPFAHHSPSLVENVTRGMQVIVSQFNKLTGVSDPIMKAYADIAKFKDLMATFRNGKAVDLEFADDLKKIKGINPAALTTAKEMIKDIKALQKQLDGLQKELDAQQAVVDAWQAKLDAANSALDEQQTILDGLNDTVSYYQGLIDDANNSIQTFADTSITGMGALNDQIEANTEAQNALKLSMAQMEAASGGFDTVKDRMAALNGEMETLTVSRDQLVKAGAGSEILSQYNKQIDAIQAQKDAIYSTADAYTKMSQELSDLQKQGDVLDLTKSVNYDPLTYQIDKLANAQKEMDYKDIVAGIQNAQQAVKDYTPDLEAATAAMKDQEAVVYSLTQERNAIQAQYDIESAKLDIIKAKYDKVTDAINALKDALQQMSSAASKANGGLGIKKGGAGGGYPGGGPKLTGKTTSIKDMAGGTAKDIKNLTDKLNGIADGLDFTKPIRKAWDNAVKWWLDNIQPALDDVGKGISNWFITTNWSGIFAPITNAWDVITKFFGDDFKVAWDKFMAGIQDFTKNAAPGFSEFWTKIQPLIGDVGTILWQTFETIGVIAGVILKILLFIWNSVVQPLMAGAGSIFSDVMKALSGIAEFLDGWLSQGSFEEKMGKVLHGILTFADGIMHAASDMITGIGNAAISILVNLGTAIWSVLGPALTTLWNNISNWFASLLQIPWIATFVNWVNTSFVGMRNWIIKTVSDIVTGIGSWFSHLPGNVAKWIGDTVRGAVAWFRSMPGKILVALVTLSTSLSTRAISWLASIISGLGKKVSDVITWFKNLPGKILGALGDLGTILFKAGQSVIQGLWDGLVDMWNRCKTWITGIADWIRQHKGPISADYELLQPAGAAIMAGFNKTLLAGFKDTKSLVGEVTGMFKGADLSNTLRKAALGSTSNIAPSTITNNSPVSNRNVIIQKATFEFPNVKNGKDAQDFLDNLEALL